MSKPTLTKITTKPLSSKGISEKQNLTPHNSGHKIPLKKQSFTPKQTRKPNRRGG